MRARNQRAADLLVDRGWTCIPPGALDGIGPYVANRRHVFLSCDRCGESIAQYNGEPAMLQQLVSDALDHTCQES